jgi:MFS family permease
MNPNQTEESAPSRSAVEEQGVTAALPGARMALMLLIGINLFNFIDRQVLAAVVPYIRGEFFSGPAAAQHSWFTTVLIGLLKPFFGSNPENAMIGLLAMAFMVTYMLAAPVFSFLKLNRWWIIGVGVILWSLASGASGIAASFGMLLLTRCAVGIGEAAYGPIAPTVISDLYPVSMRGRMLSWFYLAVPVGSALGFVLGGAVASSLGWQWAFYLVVPPGVLLGLLCWRMKEPPHGGADALKEGQGERKRGMNWSDVKILLNTPSYLWDTVGMTCMTFAIGGIGFWMPSYIHEFRGVANLAQVNLIFGGIVVVSGLAATICGGFLGDKLRQRFSGSYFLVSGAALLFGMPFLVASLYVPFPYAWGCIFVACFGLFFGTGPTNTILANVVHPSLRVTAFALNILIIHAFGDVISPLVIGGITDATGSMSKAFLVVSALVLVGSFAWLNGARHLKKDTDLALTRISK